MSLVTIASQDIADWHGAETPAFARLIANQEFITSENVIVAPGDGFYQQFGCSVVGNKIQIAAGSAYSTTDSDTPWATYTLAVYSAKGHLLTTIAGNLRIPDTPSSTTWTALIEYSQAVVQPQRFAYYDANQMNAILSSYARGRYLTSRLESNFSISFQATAQDTPIAIEDVPVGEYIFDCLLHLTEGGAGGFRWNFNGTAVVPNFIGEYTARESSSLDTILNQIRASTFTAQPNFGAGSTAPFIRMQGTMEVSSEGSVVLQAGQKTASGPITIQKGSHLILIKTN